MLDIYYVVLIQTIDASRITLVFILALEYSGKKGAFGTNLRCFLHTNCVEFLNKFWQICNKYTQIDRLLLFFLLKNNNTKKLTISICFSILIKCYYNYKQLVE